MFFLVGLFAIPFFYSPNSMVPYEVPKVWLFNRWVEIITIAGLVFSTSKIKKDKSDNILVILLVIFLLTTIITSLLGVNFQKSLLGNFYRSDGLLTLSHLVTLFFFISIFFQKSWIKPTFQAISLSAICLSLWVLFDAFRLHILNSPSVYNWDGALAISFGNPNFLSGYLLVALPFTAYLIHISKKRKKYLIAGLLFEITAIFLTFAKAGIIGIVIFAILWLAIWKKTKLKLIILLIFTFIITIPYFFAGETTYKSGVLVSESRQRIYTKAYLAFLEKPITGWGWSNFDYAFDSINWPLRVENDVYVDKAHSMILEVLISTGLVGLLLYILLIGKSVINLGSSDSKISRYLLLSLILYLLHSQINIISVSEETIFWIIVGISTKRSLIH